MRRALSSSADWMMERRLPKSEKALVSSGTVECRLGESGIEWRTLKPFRSLVAMRGGSMVFEDEDGRRERPASDMPRYGDIRKATDAFAAGKTDAFYEVFDAEAEFVAGGGWKVVIRPRPAALRELVESVEISGAELPTSATLRSANGTVSRISFSKRRGNAE